MKGTNPMNLVITMAGKYSRFKNAGYGIPKYLLPFGNRSILAEILCQLTPRLPVSATYLVANKEDEPHAGHIGKIMEALGIPRENLLFIADTTGQAETAKIAIEKFNINGKVVFHNADTILYNRHLSYINTALEKCAGFIDVFRSNNHAYSYVVVAGDRVAMIGEKVLVSELATSGLYCFAEARDFLSHYEGQTYISEIYQSMLKQGKDIKIGTIHDEEDTLVLGTPEDYLRISAKL